MASRHDKDKGVNVQVLLRCRPFSEEEVRSNAPQVVSCNEWQREVTVCQNIASKQIDRTFTFDKVFGPSAQQKDLYDQAVVPIVNEVLEGFNCTIFAYGQTGTGKTYTMEGECKKTKGGQSGGLPTDAGVIPRAVKQIFDTLESQNAEYSVKVTFLELYNEEITDLLAPEELSKIATDDKQRKPLALMEDGKGGVLVRGLEEEIVTSASEIFTLLERGSAKRRTAETLLNKQSSRSHSLFSITIHIKEATPEGEELIKCGKLNLVDLAGSENISRSGAREGRAREAGEINKSLLTLGRVITALVEHLGHIPYRDSKLTRLLRDSLGGRTKTCIIATVSPSVHCLEETLSTLDYAHRAKNIKNKPEVNQKMMKSTLIKDLYCEIERLKTEVYAAREKCGVYIPKERYYQEETEKKAMADKIEQMDYTLEENNKRIEDLQDRYEKKQHLCTELSSKLEFTQKILEQSRKTISALKEDYKQAKFAIKEREYIISNHRKAENTLTEQACTLRSDLERSVKDIAGLFAKIERKEKVSDGNRALVDNFQTELAKQLGQLCNTVVESMTQQNNHLHSLEQQFHACMDFKDKSAEELKQKVVDLRASYFSHLESLQNIARLHKAGSNASLDDIKSSASMNVALLEETFAVAVKEADSVLGDVQTTLSEQQGEMAAFAQQTREKARISIELIKSISDATMSFFENLSGEASKLQQYIEQSYEAQEKSITEFQNAYEEQSRQEEQQLLSDISNLVAKAMVRKVDMVKTRLACMRETSIKDKESFDLSVACIQNTTFDSKRKWETFAKQAADDANDNSALSAAKHCRMEVLLQQCVNTTDHASQHWKATQKSVQDISRDHAIVMDSLVRDSLDANENHAAEIEHAKISAEADVQKINERILCHVDGLLDHEHNAASQIHSTIESQSQVIKKLENEHQNRVTEIEKQAELCFRGEYMEDQSTFTTPTRGSFEIPSRDDIENFRAPAFEVLIQEFRDNNGYDVNIEAYHENGILMEKPYQESPNSRDSRIPLTQINLT
ncbi:hypothetical protein SUGI_1164380 [Cryptomeria japonica]|uniref:kinesin-like protein KIN-5C n=1 Tax=Cryptomeria japonica TaxID=3369 RepID=UPI0024149E44|nr:kinesin-like protein KIN-5C [Cryptomeria japonica]GLJ54279.1 hypothetical protein SUGI_1164380 [Cryptomeria japonica]